jgi:hypothetical protein
VLPPSCKEQGQVAESALPSHRSWTCCLGRRHGTHQTAWSLQPAIPKTRERCHTTTSTARHLRRPSTCTPSLGTFLVQTSRLDSSVDHAPAYPGRVRARFTKGDCLAFPPLPLMCIRPTDMSDAPPSSNMHHGLRQMLQVTKRPHMTCQYRCEMCPERRPPPQFPATANSTRALPNYSVHKTPPAASISCTCT